MRIFNVMAAGALLLSPIAAAADTPSAPATGAKAAKEKKVCRVVQAAVGRLPERRVCTTVKAEQEAAVAPVAKPAVATPAAQPAVAAAARDVQSKDRKVCRVVQAAVGRLPERRVCTTVKAEQVANDSLDSLAGADHAGIR